MSKRFVTMLAGVAALAMLVGGCGSSGDDETLTKAEFIKQADAMCQKANKQFGKEFQALAKENKKNGTRKTQSITEEGIEVGEKIYVPNAQERAEGLEELPPPEGEEEKIEAIVVAIEKGVEEGEKDPKSLMSSSDFPFLESNKLQQDYGFKFCGAGQAG